MPKPIKRHQALQPVSREHHYGLLLSWKIRQGFKHEIDPARIKKYTDWFWKHHLQSHFEFEETYIFPILDDQNELIKRAIREHKRLQGLFSAPDAEQQNLASIEEELVDHIRFEERILFKEVEQIASKDQLKIIEKEHTKKMVEEWGDKFWMT